jgi:mannose-1-phosphate guanylyltransferase / mannose-6-phosphate isomerase
MNLVIPVILSGGSGARLWPLSRVGLPKQFLVLPGSGTNQSLFQQTITRINGIGQLYKNPADIQIGSTLVITNEEHRFLVLEQLRELDSIAYTLLLEPIGRNTAPALSMAAFYAAQISRDDPILVITPSDQIIQDQEAFIKALHDCIRVVEAKDEVIAILGIKPTSAETGYGYVKRSGPKDLNNSYAVESFVEKPDAKTAQTYLENSDYLWNAGIFVLRVSTWLAALQEFRPDIFESSQKAWQVNSSDSISSIQFIRPGANEFKNIPSESIDYAVIEKCPGSRFLVKLVELDAGWSDLGSWDAVWQIGNKDEDKNVVSGDVILLDSKNCLIHSSARLVSAVGLENMVIVETADALLVAHKSMSQDIKNIVNQLDFRKDELKDLHRKVIRPWGWYDSIDQGENFKVKRIQVNPGASLSLQKHQHRAEHWVVVKGTAEITNGDQVFTLKENQSTYIPQGQTHRITNRSTESLEIIEVQSGDYLGEDDIIRFEDTYGRG